MSGQRFGYARVSTLEQTLDAQNDALKRAGCDRIFAEKASGGKREREQLAALMDHLRRGDTLICTKLDRIARSMSHLLEIVEKLRVDGVDLVVLDQGIDTTTSTGRLMFHVLAAIGEFERDLIRDRTLAGLAAARDRGRVGGRPRAMSETQAQLARAMHAARDDEGAQVYTVAEIAKELNVARGTVYRYLPGGEHSPVA